MRRSTTDQPGAAGTPGEEVEAKPAEVLRFLRRNPDFLFRNPEILEELKAPFRSAGSGVIDLQHFMVERLRGDMARLRADQDDLVSTSRDNLSNQSRIHKAVLALLGAPTFEQLIEVVTIDFAMLLDVDVACLCIETQGEPNRRIMAGGVHLIEPGTVDALFGRTRDVMLRTDVTGDPEIFAGAAGLVRSDALVRLAVSKATPPGLIAFGTRHPGYFHPGQGTELLTFLARVLEHCIREWLDLPS